MSCFKPAAVSMIRLDWCPGARRDAFTPQRIAASTTGFDRLGQHSADHA